MNEATLIAGITGQNVPVYLLNKERFVHSIKCSVFLFFEEMSIDMH